MISDIIKVFIPAILSFGVGIFLAPFLTNYLYKNEMWKKRAKTVAVDGTGTPIFNSLHKDRETKVPRMGGIIIWASSTIVILILAILSHIFDGEFFSKLDFLTRNQTWIPLCAMLIGAIVGLFDDYLDIKGSEDYKAGGLSLKKRLFTVGIIGALVAIWFFFKLDVVNVGIPFDGEFYVGWLIIPIFIAVMALIYSGGIIDGLDGLAGGLFAIMFGAYSIIAFNQSQINLSAFCAAIVGSLLAFLWFNIPPARFYMSETGSMALTVTLTIIAFMTDSLGEGKGLLVLPIIALPLIITTISVIIQIISKRFRNGKKVFLVAPLHHHFEAIGWPAYKVTMRYWIIGLICAIVGVIIALFG